MLLWGPAAVEAVAAVMHSLDCSLVVAGHSLGCIDRNFAAHTVDMLHCIVAADCSIVHTAVIDRSLRVVGKVVRAETIVLRAGRY